MLKEKRLKREELEIEVFNDISIGNPMAFKKYKDEELIKNIYNINIKDNKEWVAKGFFGTGLF